MALEKCSGLLSGVTRLGMWVRDHRTLCLRGSHLHHSINVSIQHRPKKRFVPNSMCVIKTYKISLFSVYWLPPANHWLTQSVPGRLENLKTIFTPSANGYQLLLVHNCLYCHFFAWKIDGSQTTLYAAIFYLNINQPLSILHY